MFTGPSHFTLSRNWLPQNHQNHHVGNRLFLNIILTFIKRFHAFFNLQTSPRPTRNPRLQPIMLRANLSFSARAGLVGATIVSERITLWWRKKRKDQWKRNACFANNVASWPNFPNATKKNALTSFTLLLVCPSFEREWFFSFFERTPRFFFLFSSILRRKSLSLTLFSIVLLVPKQLLVWKCSNLDSHFFRHDISLFSITSIFHNSCIFMNFMPQWRNMLVAREAPAMGGTSQTTQRGGKSRSKIASICRPDQQKSVWYLKVPSDYKAANDVFALLLNNLTQWENMHELGEKVTCLGWHFSINTKVGQHEVKNLISLPPWYEKKKCCNTGKFL